MDGVSVELGARRRWPCTREDPNMLVLLFKGHFGRPRVDTQVSVYGRDKVLVATQNATYRLVAFWFGSDTHSVTFWLGQGGTQGHFSPNFLPLLPTTFTPLLLHHFRRPTGARGEVVVRVAASDRVENRGLEDRPRGRAPGKMVRFEGRISCWKLKNLTSTSVDVKFFKMELGDGKGVVVYPRLAAIDVAVNLTGTSQQADPLFGGARLGHAVSASWHGVSDVESVFVCACAEFYRTLRKAPSG
ncbi:hypothetical protein Taro_045541 [Colocasia esculenta]|uniref:Uncharacterized protein n=1 Tax=Colocasia esculenta TaxID=4460 RepID=A0A843WXB2_COLES|nr:hypothetical protein [Colocasia esculenta]